MLAAARRTRSAICASHESAPRRTPEETASCSQDGESTW
jgi:hypothetical protein